MHCVSISSNRSCGRPVNGVSIETGCWRRGDGRDGPGESLTDVAAKAGAAPARRPLVTVGLVTYRQERYVREAVRSVLAQTYSPLQVVVCDDASPDTTFDILRREVDAHGGAHEVVLHRNEQNLGIGNFNKVMELAEGEFVVIAHGDDVSRLVTAWLKSGVSLVSSNGTLTSEDGRDIGLVATANMPKRISRSDLAQFGSNLWLFGGALAWERRVFDLWGPLDPDRSAVSTDWIIPFRAALLRGIAIVDEPLVRVRRHPESKAHLYIHSPDEVVHRESNLANVMTQLMSMLDTVGEGQTKGVVSRETGSVLRQQLTTAILQATQWRTQRNRLLAQGRRAQWLPVQNP
jgi:Glycosyl transferase family 2